MASSGQQFPGMASSGQQFPGMASSGQQFPGMASSGQQFPGMSSSGQQLPASIGRQLPPKGSAALYNMALKSKTKMCMHCGIYMVGGSQDPNVW